MRLLSIIRSFKKEACNDLFDTANAVCRGYKNGRNQTQTNVFNSTKQITSSVFSEIGTLNSVKGMTNATKEFHRELSIAARTSSLYHHSKIKSYLCKIECIKKSFKNIKENATIDDIPALAGVAGMCIPVPLANPAMAFAGKIVQLFIKSIKYS